MKEILEDGWERLRSTLSPRRVNLSNAWEGLQSNLSSMTEIFEEAWEGLRSNLSMIFSVVMVTFLSLTFVGVAALLQMQIGQMKTYWYDKAQVAVYLCSEFSVADACDGIEASEAQIDTVRAQLQSEALAPYIDTFYFESRQDAYAAFQREFAGDAITELVTPDLLPQTFWVNLVNPNQSDVLVKALTGLGGVEQVADQRSYLDGIFAVLNAASLTSAVVAALMLASATTLIMTTIRLSAFTRRKELTIMRLVGASNWFIKGPFLVEAALAAFAGAALAGMVTVGIVRFFVQGFLASALPQTSFVGVGDAFLVVPGLFLVALGLAVGAANLSIEKYLKA
jgi:cell division transport system permease protein